jgi:hypothetical protein
MKSDQSRLTLFTQAVKYKGSLDAARQIFANEGTRSFFKGAGANILRGVAGAGVLSIYDQGMGSYARLDALFADRLQCNSFYSARPSRAALDKLLPSIRRYQLETDGEEELWLASYDQPCQVPEAARREEGGHNFVRSAPWSRRLVGLKDRICHRRTLGPRHRARMDGLPTLDVHCTLLPWWFLFALYPHFSTHLHST